MHCIISRLPYRPVVLLMFSGGICTGSILGLLLGLLERDSVNLILVSLTALLCGAVSTLIGLVYTVVFNLLAPVIGGIPLQLTAPSDKPTPDPPPAPAPPQ